MGDYFIMINHPNGEIMPMITTANDVDDKVLTFPDFTMASNAASEHGMCLAYGYEIFQRGTGAQ